jgi:hypothetical protein
MSIFNKTTNTSKDSTVKDAIIAARYQGLESLDDVKGYVNWILQLEMDRLTHKYKVQLLNDWHPASIRKQELRDLQTSIREKTSFDKIVTELENRKAKTSTSLFSTSGCVGRFFSRFGLFKSTGEDNINLLINQLKDKSTVIKAWIAAKSGESNFRYKG